MSDYLGTPDGAVPASASHPTSLRIVGLDLSLTATGVAIIAADRARALTIRSKGKADDGLLTRSLRLHNLSLDILHVAATADIVIIEQPAYGQTGGSHHDRSGLWWLVMDGLTNAVDGCAGTRHPVGSPHGRGCPGRALGCAGGLLARASDRLGRRYSCAMIWRAITRPARFAPIVLACGPYPARNIRGSCQEAPEATVSPPDFS
ncbi:hypothetical protein ACFVXD_45160, partial [Kitasatospora herbaricolor]